MLWSKLLSHKRSHKERTTYDRSRPPWQVDFDRLIFSSAFRRLQDKTQVHPLSSSDYVRTRLTHSLEVSCVARSLGTLAGTHILEKYGDEPYDNSTLGESLTPSDIGMMTCAAALAHDIGNPPFGHSGEDAIRYWFATSPIAQKIRDKLLPDQEADFDNWEGNAEGFRIATRLQLSRNEGGMRLTSACLGAFMKYPTSASGMYPIKTPKNVKKKDVAPKKPGFFEADKEEWFTVAKELGLKSTGKGRWCRHPLAYLTEAADDICYRIVDLEDGHRIGRVTYAEFRELMVQLLSEEIVKESEVKYPKDGENISYLRARSINQGVNEAAELFQKWEPDLLKGDPRGELMENVPSADAWSAIKAKTTRRIYSMRNVLEIEAAGFKIIPGLLDIFVDAVEQSAGNDAKTNKALFANKVIDLIPSEYLGTDRAPIKDPYERLLAIIDFVSGMTDTYALDLFRKLRGVSI